MGDALIRLRIRKKHKKTGCEREMAGDFSTIVYPYLWKRLVNDYDRIMNAIFDECILFYAGHFTNFLFTVSALFL